MKIDGGKDASNAEIIKRMWQPKMKVCKKIERSLCSVIQILNKKYFEKLNPEESKRFFMTS